MTTKRPLAVLALSLAACGGAGEPPPSGATDGRLQLSSDLAGDAVSAARVVRTLRFEPGGGGFDVRDGQGEVIRDRRAAGEDWVLALRGEGAKAVALPGPFEAHGFERVALELTVAGFESVQAAAVLSDGARLNSGHVGVDSSEGSQVVLLDIPHLRLSNQPVRELLIRFAGKAGDVGVHRVDWISQPVTGWLPRVDEAPRPVRLGAESRLAFGFTSEERLRVRHRVGGGEVLSFGYGVPRDLGLLGDPARLRVRVEGGAQRIEREYELAGLRTASLWQEARIELDALAGEEVEVTFELPTERRVPVICALSDVRVRDPRAGAPLVFLMTSDTHRADHVGVAGLGVEIDTPNLDGLARRGVWFGNCWSTTNVTNPSHVALMTGVHPRDHGVVTNSMQLAFEAPTLAEAFREAGWMTFGVVSNASLGPSRCGLEQGFDRFAVPERKHPGDADEAVERLLEWWPAADGAPLFCWLHVFDAHEPYEPPERALVELYYPAGQDPFDPALPPLEGVGDRLLPESLHGLRDLAWPRASYRAEITYLDRQLGRLLAQPRFEDAIVGVTADHGESLDAHGVFFSHADLYPDSLHVPLILAWPGAPAGARVDRPVEQAWLGRTLLDLAGLEDVEFPGADLRAWLAAEAPPAAPRYALSAGRRTASITAWPWHLTLHLREHRNPTSRARHEQHAVRLFDLERDPGSEHDLIQSGAEPERARRLRERLVEWLNTSAPLGWGSEGNRSPEVLDELAKLGYATDDPVGASEQLVDPGCECAWCQRFR